jgi:hypothetical protein
MNHLDDSTVSKLTASTNLHLSDLSIHLLDLAKRILPQNTLRKFKAFLRKELARRAEANMI